MVLFLTLLTLVGFSVSLGITGLNRRAEAEPVAGWRVTTGTVIKADIVPGIKSPVYAPVIQFAADGRVVTFSGPTSSDIPVAGSHVQVSYDPHHPADAHDISLSSIWEWQFYTGLASLPLEILVIAKGISTIMRIRRRRRVMKAAASFS